jgi:diketogulonate reductase-like aldo/keto reductase
MNQQTNTVARAYTLANGVQIPSMGFGTWQAQDGAQAVQAVQDALAAGYRHIDTAATYGNEASVGQAIKTSGIARDDLFITTKLWNDVRGYDETLRAFEASMQKLQLDVLDLYLIHWPNPAPQRPDWQTRNAESWRAFEKLYADGRIRAIGVSNFCEHHLDELLKTAHVAPMVNQIMLCPGETKDALVSYMRAHNMLPEAYSPLGHGVIFSSPEMQAIAAKYGKSVAQVTLRWSLERGYLPLPKSVTQARIVENLDVYDFSLDAADIERINHINGYGTPPTHPDDVNF